MFGVGDVYKYLGILLGKGSAESMWIAAEAKFEDRLRAIRALGAALGAVAHRVLALSVLGFLMQVLPPRSWDRFLKTTVRQLLPGPAGWLPTPWAFQSPVDFALPSTLLSPDVLHMAALSRTASDHRASDARGGLQLARAGLGGW